MAAYSIFSTIRRPGKRPQNGQFSGQTLVRSCQIHGDTVFVKKLLI